MAVASGKSCILIGGVIDIAKKEEEWNRAC